ncbi:MAG: Gfo/Idh/MocA family oxidoreductase [Methanomassiliicoccales archaeon]|jgi:UDP-N-acetylglucosamine 3-dehydrogenase
MMKVGVIGVGAMGRNHARVYSEIAHLVGVTDAVPGQAKEIAERLGVIAFENVDSLLDQVDAVSVCTPTSYHFDTAMKAISKGKHLLVEKPFTGDSKKAAELCLAAEREGVTVASGFIERCNPIVTVAKEAMESGRFGKVISLASRRVSSFPSRIRDVGVIMDLGIHDVDVMRHITSSNIRSVYAVGGMFANPSFEDYANLLMEFENGAVGFVEVNWLTPMKVRKVSFTCSGGFVQMDYTDQSLEVSTSKVGKLDQSDMFRIPLECDVRRVSVRKEEPLKAELEQFLKAAESGGEPAAGGSDAVQNLKVCEAALDSMRTHGKSMV